MDTRQPDYPALAERLATHGYAVVPDFLSPDQTTLLRNEALALHDGGQMRRAGVGKGEEYSINDTLRGDFIHWLEETSATSPACQDYLARLENLRLEINRTLYLGLFDFEGHFAIYPPGAFYRKHLDQFQRDSRRTLTAILYLNQDWQESDGGQLRVYTDEQNHFDVLPQGGTLMTFISDRYWHEVLPASRERMSITGWFRVRAA